MTFPESLAEQITYVAGLENQLSEINTLSRSYVLTQRRHPTQLDWEDFWLEQGNTLPIPTDVELYWHDGVQLRGMFSTTEDIFCISGRTAMTQSNFPANWDKRTDTSSMLWGNGLRGTLIGPDEEPWDHADSATTAEAIIDETGEIGTVIASGFVNRLEVYNLASPTLINTIHNIGDGATADLQHIEFRNNTIVLVDEDTWDLWVIESAYGGETSLNVVTGTTFLRYALHPTEDVIYYVTDDGTGHTSLYSRPMDTTSSSTLLYTFDGDVFTDDYVRLLFVGNDVVYLSNVTDPPGVFTYIIDSGEINFDCGLGKFLTYDDTSYEYIPGSNEDDTQSLINNWIFGGVLLNSQGRSNETGQAFFPNVISSGWSLVVADVDSGVRSTGRVFPVTAWSSPWDDMELLLSVSLGSATDSVILDGNPRINTQINVDASYSGAIPEPVTNFEYYLDGVGSMGHTLIQNDLESTITLSPVSGERSHRVTLHIDWYNEGTSKAGTTYKVNDFEFETDWVIEEADGSGGYFVHLYCPSYVWSQRQDPVVTVTVTTLDSGYGAMISSIEIYENDLSPYSTFLITGSYDTDSGREINLIFNDDTTAGNYRYLLKNHTGTNPSTFQDSPGGSVGDGLLHMWATTNFSSVSGMTHVWITNANNNVWKGLINQTGYINGTTSYPFFAGGMWFSREFIEKIEINPELTGQLQSGTEIRIYGLRSTGRYERRYIPQ